MTVRAAAPGRVNLLGDHVDYVGGIVLPMAIDLGITVTFEPGGDRLELQSDNEAEPATVALPAPGQPPESPAWARYPAAVAHEMGATTGGVGTVTSTLPAGAGLSSSAALEIALALALGADPDDKMALAWLCQRAEHRATGVPTGLMDQLAILHGQPGAALLIDCRALTVAPVALPAGTAVHAVHCGVSRRLEGSEYADRRRQCEVAESVVGALRDASLAAVEAIDDAVVRRRARHVVTEIARVAEAAGTDDPHHLGQLMDASHRSLRDDFEVSIPELDDLVEQLRTTDGVYGARLTGAGFGGCAVALVDADIPAEVVGGWRLVPSAGAAVERQ
ncbi:MAG: galactokinase [Acidimicrobiia bacterium]|nr:galactokinase [Acidimicrobiia bacterium]